MSYCDFQDVRTIVDTDITDIEITDLIVGIQAMQDLVLSGGGPNPTIRKEICRRWTAITCMLKDPDSETLGEYRMSRAPALRMLRDELAMWMKHAEGGISTIVTYEPM